MFMITRKLVLLGVFAVFLMSPGAQAKPRLAVVGDVNYSLPKTDGEADLGFGAGLLGEITMGSHLALEVGGLYLVRKLKSSGQIKHINVPASLKVYLGSKFWLGAGAHYDFGLNDGADMHGAHGGLGVALPLGQSAALILDARYLYDLRNSGTLNTVHALVGIRFGGMSKK